MRILFSAMAFLMLGLTSAQSAEYIVNIEDFVFGPPTLNISIGDKVRFVNKDGAPHTATADAGSFDTDRLSRGDNSVIVFNGAGTFSYFCSIHPSMKATIIVQ